MYNEAMVARKKSMTMLAREAMMTHGYDPLEELIFLAQSTDDRTEKREIAEALLPYMYPRLSAVAVQTMSENTGRSTSQTALMMRILSNPELADAAQRLSIATVEHAMLADSSGEYHVDVVDTVDGSDNIQ